MLQAYWLPAALRIPHVVEILASTLAYAAVLAILFGRSERAAGSSAAARSN